MFLHPRGLQSFCHVAWIVGLFTIANKVTRYVLPFLWPATEDESASFEPSQSTLRCRSLLSKLNTEDMGGSS